MKLLHIAPIGHHAEGIGSVLKELVPAQINAGADVRIITIYENKIYLDLPITSLNDVDELRRYLDIWKPDFVLFHSIYSMSYIAFYRELLLRNIPYGIQMHGGLSKENYRKNQIKKFIANLLFFNRFMRKARTIVYLSESEYQRCIVKSLNPHNTIIPNGSKSQSIELEKLLPSKKIEIIFIGRISMYVKGLDVLLEAINMMTERTDVHFSIYGNEDDIHTDKLKYLIRGKEGIVEYRGGLYGKEKELVMRRANIFILTSPSEGMPMGVLEALSYGIPCIVTPGTNMADVIDNNKAGWVAQYNSTDIKNVILKAISDYRLNQREYRNAAYEVSKQFSWENVAILSLKEIGKLCKLHNH